MKQSYLRNYLKIYSWKGFSVFINLVSMFIVVPRITSEPTIYGVYMVCISTAIFLSYADIGFIGAGYKYSAECFARKDLKSEMEIQGFVSFVLTFFISFFVIFYLTISFKPDLLIKDLGNPNEIAIASKLLLIQAIFSYTVVLQRLNNAVFGIRLEDYIFQKIQIIVYVIRISSIFYFFRSESYDIVGYFLFSKLMELAGVSFSLFLAKQRYGYSFILLVKSFKFSRKIFNKTKNLALGSFYVTIMWILYYELDTIAISKLLGAKAVAYYAIGLTISTFFRTLSGIIYSPFMARFNHYVGVHDLSGLKDYYLMSIKRTMPLIVFPAICVVVLMKPLILSWVGAEYFVSIRIATFLILSSPFIFITTPTSNLVVALEKIKLLYIISTIIALLYWCGVIATINYWHVESFAIFKFISLFTASLFYCVIALKFLEISALKFLKEVFLPISGAVVLLVASLMLVAPLLPAEKGTANLVFVVSTGAVFSLLAFGLYYLTSKDFKGFINESVEKLKKGKSMHPIHIKPVQMPKPN